MSVFIVNFELSSVKTDIAFVTPFVTAYLVAEITSDPGRASTPS